MTEAIHQWILSIAAAAVLAALCQGMMPAGTVREISRLTCGLLLFVVVVRPLARTDFERVIEQLADQYRALPTVSICDLEQTNTQLTRQLIASQTAAYIEERAQTEGIACRVAVECTTEGTVPTPKSVTVRGTLTPEQKSTVTALAVQELSIEQNAVYFTEEQGGGA